MQKITPFLWFDHNAEEAANFYVSIFENAKVGSVARYDEAGAKVSGRPAGSAMTVPFQLRGQDFIALNGGPMFKFTPAISFFVYCAADGIDRLFRKLSQGGEILMPLDKYPFAEKYAFFQDKFGVPWQLMLSPDQSNIAPCLLFVGKDLGKAEAAVKFYTAVFKNAGVRHLVCYGKGEPGQEGTVKHSTFLLEGQEFMAMDGAGPHAFMFNESVSFVVNCETQQEVDGFWERLSAGGQEVQCGWLKDKFGVSWQVVPTLLAKLLQDKDAQKSKRVMEAMLRMKKIDMGALQGAYDRAK